MLQYVTGTLGHSEAAEAWSATKDTTSTAVLEAFVARYKDTFMRSWHLGFQRREGAREQTGLQEGRAFISRAAYRVTRLQGSGPIDDE